MGTLAGVIFLRVLGVSLLLAGFVEHGHALGGTTLETGIAFGAYPLALAVFMLPLGALSDRIGRRAAMVGGLLVSSVGALVAASANDIILLTVGRFVQGAGAVNAIALATAAETGEPDRRTRRMAMLGAAAGGGFAAGLLLGAYLLPFLGVRGLLLMHGALNLALVPAVLRALAPGVPPRAPVVAVKGGAWWLGLAGFALNLSMTGLLFLSPLLVEAAAPGASYGLVLTAMVLPGGLGMFVSSRFADRGHARVVGLLGALLLALAPLPFLGRPGVVLLVVAGIAYFIGHSSITSLLPSLAARIAPERQGGRVQGVLSTLQALGSFFGASLAGALHGSAPGLAAMFLSAGACVAWGVLVTEKVRTETI
jgi:MFS family permease